MNLSTKELLDMQYESCEKTFTKVGAGRKVWIGSIGAVITITLFMIANALAFSERLSKAETLSVENGKRLDRIEKTYSKIDTKLDDICDLLKEP